MLKGTLYFIDIETNSNSIWFNKDDQEIIQVGIYNHRNKKEFNQFVNIKKNLSENIKRLTWISDKDIEKWSDLKTVLDNAIKFIDEDDDPIIVGHNLEEFDLYLLSKYDNRFSKYKYIDTLHLFLFLFPWFKSYTVQDLYRNFFDKDYEEQHQALQDSKDECKLFEKILNVEFLKKYYIDYWKNLEFIKTILSKYDSNLNDNCAEFEFINDLLSSVEGENSIKLKSKLIEKYFKRYNFKNNEEIWDINIISDNEMEEEYTEFINSTGKSIRKEQQSMVQHIKDVLDEKVHDLFIQAWTWTWKTFWYLIPAAKFIEKNPNWKIFIATYTKVLQEQLMQKDVPVLKQRYPNVCFEQLKADSEAISLHSIPYKGQLSFWDLALWNRLYRWNFYLSDIHFSLQLKIWQEKLLWYSNNVLMSDYHLDDDYWFKWDFYDRLNRWNIFVINQAFMVTKFGKLAKNRFTWLTSIKDYPTIFPEDSYLIVDEWHNLESVIRDFLTLDYTKINIEKVLSLISKDSKINIVTIIDGKIEFYESVLENLPEESDKKEWILFTIQWLKKISVILSKTLSSDAVSLIQEQFLKIDKSIRISKFYKNAVADIIKLRDLWYDTTISEYDKDTFTSLYDCNELNDLFNFSSKFFGRMLDKLMQYTTKETRDFIDRLVWWLKRYFWIWFMLLNSDSRDYFFTSLIELSESKLDLVNYWFKAIPLKLDRWSSFLKESRWNVVLSATLFDKWKDSYLLKEVFWKEYNYARIQKYNSPFDYKNQRKIMVIESEDENTKNDILFKFINEYKGRTLILTNTLAEKRRITMRCKEKFDKEWILTLMHVSWTLASKTNQRNVECLKENPKTILVWSKSYAEWVDVPWDNVQLVVMTKLPFLPPSPFISHQNKARKSKWNNYVYKFLCSINFRQSIWRLIRTTSDKWVILIMDNRLVMNSWKFFQDYIEWEKVISL